MFRAVLIVLAATLPFTAQAMDMIKAGPLVISTPFSLETPPRAKSGAGFLTIENTGDTDELLMGATSVAGKTMLHKTEVDSNGISRMEHQMGGIPIPAGETVALEPGGYHIMIMGLDAPLVAGAVLDVTLTFQNAGDVAVTLPIITRDAMQGGHGGHGEATDHSTHSN